MQWGTWSYKLLFFKLTCTEIQYWNLYFYQTPQKLRFFIFFDRQFCSMLPGKSKFHLNFFYGFNRKIFHAPSGNLSLKTINRKCNCEDEVSSRKLAVLKNSIFWKSSSCENVCSAIYDETLSKNRFPHLNCT